jgi:hypothetical protein
MIDSALAAHVCNRRSRWADVYHNAHTAPWADCWGVELRGDGRDRFLGAQFKLAEVNTCLPLWCDFEPIPPPEVARRKEPLDDDDFGYLREMRDEGQLCAPTDDYHDRGRSEAVIAKLLAHGCCLLTGEVNDGVPTNMYRKPAYVALTDYGRTILADYEAEAAKAQAKAQARVTRLRAKKVKAIKLALDRLDLLSLASGSWLNSLSMVDLEQVQQILPLLPTKAKDLR